MIVFHEGLPGSGKSYEACVLHILQALESGRRVITNIEGINHAKFSELTHIPLLELREQLVCIFEDGDLEKQKTAILEHSGKDTLVVIDEIQNLFPSERQKLSPEWNKYISEHRHDGLDIILMGQDRKDCHTMWRRRIQRIITFNKLSAVGKDNSYRWECLEATRPEKYKKVTSGVRQYKALYFGLYSSHTNGTENKSVYSDDRANIRNNKLLRWGVPLMLVMLFFAVSHLMDFFSTPAQAENTAKPKTYNATKLKSQANALREQQLNPQPAATSQPVQPVEPAPIDIFDGYAKKYRLRLAALITTPKDDSRLYARIDVLDKSFHIQEAFTVSGLRDMGWDINYRESGLYITKEGVTHIARAWPIDKPGRVDNYTATSL